MEYSVDIFEAIKKLLVAGCDKFFSRATMPLTDDSLAWPLTDGKYLFVVPWSSTTIYLDSQMKPLAAKVSEADRWIVSHAMDAFSEKSSSLFEAKGWLDEMTCNRRFAMVYYLKKALELGPDRLKLSRSKIIDDYFFYCVEVDLYYVFRLNAEKDDFEVFTADLPEIDAIVPRAGIFALAENVVIGRLKGWVEEDEMKKKE